MLMNVNASSSYLMLSYVFFNTYFYLK
uniref:Uncharacterized protein n=1 Tax=Heterorhabditis bacteriophora TaxID=37862 RepID=A0A1I7WUC8_HETBA